MVYCAMQKFTCRLCQHETSKVIDFGSMPIANNFVKSKENDTYRFNMTATFCSLCYMFQINEQPEPAKMFHSEYPFFTSSSENMKKHFKLMAKNHLPTSKNKEEIFVVEIGSNDGTFLKNIAEEGINHLGIDPSSNVVEIAQNQGINSEVHFFSEQTAEQISKRYQLADRIFAANVVCHIPNLNDFVKGIKTLLHPEGQFIFEEPYLLSMLEKTSYDQIYDEHVYIFSLKSIQYLFSKHELELVDAALQPTHGGSMRYIIQHKGRGRPTTRALNYLEREELIGVSKLSTYSQFAEKCEENKSQFVKLLKSLKSQGKIIGGYAATSKSTTVLNYCKIGIDLISYISDSTPEKIGKMCPGSYIPVISHEEMRVSPPDYLVLFGWNHEEEILNKERELSRSGLKWIRFVPEVKIFDGKH
jgi:SAM-dependent methyltransferase